MRRSVATEPGSELARVVGDPEDELDANGYLPADCRFTMLYFHRQHRIDEVTQLRAKMPELEVAITSTADKAERSKLRAEQDVKRARLEKLLAVPRLEAEDMCADCPMPWDKHGWVTPPADGPCPAWPGWGARLKKVLPGLAGHTTWDLRVANSGQSAARRLVLDYDRWPEDLDDVATAVRDMFRTPRTLPPRCSIRVI
jgi:hypothetical protein